MGVDRIALFWPIWFSLTAAAAAGTAWAVRSCGPVSTQGAASIKPGSRVSSIALVAFLAVYSAAILVGEDFAMYDNSVFTAFSIRGISMPPPIWPPEGRFFPLGLKAHDLVGLFAKTITWFHLFSIVQLVLLAAVLLRLAGEMKPAACTGAVMFALAMPSVVVSFSSLIATERDLVVLLVLLFLAVIRFEQTGLAGYAVGAILSAQYALYCKEIVSPALLAFVGTRFAMRGWRTSRLDLCLAAASFAFLLLYVFMMFPQAGAGYLKDVGLSPVETANYYLRTDLFAWVFVAVLAVRLFRILRGVSAPELDWDAWACAGAVYFACLLVLGIAGWYYTTPVDVIGVLYLGRLTHRAWGSLSRVAKWLAAAAALVVAAQSLPITASRVFERKDIIHRKSAIADLLINLYRQDPAAAFDINFPLTNPYRLGEFAAYLAHRGLPVEERAWAGRPTRGSTIHLHGAKIVKQGKCFNEPFVCWPGLVESPRLVIAVPEDRAHGGDIEAYNRIEQGLVALHPAIEPPAWFTRILRGLRRVTPGI